METGTKFIGIKPGVDTIERKSAQANSPTDVYTVEEIRGGYKVFSGLFTCKTTSVSYESLTVGNDYLIVANDGGADFTSVGAPDSSVGTSFTATGANPNWGDPAAILIDLTDSIYHIEPLYNGLGVDVKAYSNMEAYTPKVLFGFNFSEPVDLSKVVVILPTKWTPLSYDIDNYFDIIVFNGFPTIDANIFNNPIEIRIYE